MKALWTVARAGNLADFPKDHAHKLQLLTLVWTPLYFLSQPYSPPVKTYTKYKSSLLRVFFSQPLTIRDILLLFLKGWQLLSDHSGQGIETSLGEPFEDAFVIDNMTIMWYQTAMLVAAAASAPVFGFVSQRFGRKVGTHKSLPYTYILIGISSGGVFTILLPYIREITSMRSRGFCLTMTTVMMVAGYQLRAVVREWYDPMAFLVLGLVAVQLMLVMCIVESPSYLVMVGKTEVCTPILAALFTYSQLLKLLHAHTFKYLEEYVGIHTMLYIFAGINLYGGVYALFVVPNIRNKNLKQIEKQVKRIPLPA
ncbi:Facilitated trehalose transporter Tret1 [Operophtera brumata]|uniref:Facilitated trehalose transporter Tret1 n=1 Tax=Operophtera brumata TaxID=104452 RepID=A0A0L7L9U5_OPEBR|nr:Facilitated trehalose transporter Tret1 [Operophtera brumata]